MYVRILGCLTLSDRIAVIFFRVYLLSLFRHAPCRRGSFRMFCYWQLEIEYYVSAFLSLFFFFLFNKGLIASLRS
jgi:hypothetical protein